MPSLPDRLLPGLPHPLGATPDGLGVNFAVYSAHAERIELCLFDPTGRREIARYDLPEWTDEVWHGYLPEAREGLVYGYRAHGPYDPARGHRFNPHKLLLDPYARALRGEVRWSDHLCGYRVGSPRGDLSFDRRDSAPVMAKGVVTGEAFDWGDDRPPRVPWADTVIYEAHVKGLTRLLEAVPPGERGTYAALGHPRVIDHLRRLGVTTLELLPLHANVPERFLVERGLTNYWGYNTLAFFAPEPRYAADPRDPHELRAAIRRLHAAGIEVILDVVYNHTCEAEEIGPTLSWRGLDNAGYYRLKEGDPRRYVNDTGTGNTLDLTRPRVLQMVMDSLRHWAVNYRVDGFRFDLGVTLGREAHGFDPGSGFFDAIRQDPVLSRLKLVAEPWDIGPGGYRLGELPPGFGEWNDRFRDGVRRFWRGDPGRRPDLAARLAGSADVFDRRGRRPWASVNYVASHDGFTLADATAYERKHNEANGEGNRDGHGDNHSRHWGVEGPTDDPAIRRLRARVARSLLLTVFASLGTPMLLAGDEFGRTQGGNNNAYAQDNPIAWIDWSLLEGDEGAALARFTARLAAIRRAHPVLRAGAYPHGRDEPAPGLPDIDWFDERGDRLAPADWQDPDGRVLVMRRAGPGADGAVEVLAVILNGGDAPARVRLPEPAAGWRVLVDSADADGAERPVEDGGYEIRDRAAAILIAARPAETP